MPAPWARNLPRGHPPAEWPDPRGPLPFPAGHAHLSHDVLTPRLPRTLVRRGAGRGAEGTTSPVEGRRPAPGAPERWVRSPVQSPGKSEAGGAIGGGSAGEKFMQAPRGSGTDFPDGGLLHHNHSGRSGATDSPERAG